MYEHTRRDHMAMEAPLSQCVTAVFSLFKCSLHMTSMLLVNEAIVAQIWSACLFTAHTIIILCGLFRSPFLSIMMFSVILVAVLVMDVIQRSTPSTL